MRPINRVERAALLSVTLCCSLASGCGNSPTATGKKPLVGASGSTGNPSPIAGTAATSAGPAGTAAATTAGVGSVPTTAGSRAGVAGQSVPTAGSMNAAVGGAGAVGGSSAPSGGTGGAGLPPATDGGMPSGTVEPILPKAPATCPMLKTGTVSVTSSNRQVTVQVWAGTKSSTPAPMVVYWHVTGGTSSEAAGGIGMPLSVVKEITDAGGVIVSPQNSTSAGNDTGNSVWFTGDFGVADQLVACAFQQYNLDPRRIYTAGGSAGALQAGAMVYQRSNYIAASLPNSGGYATGGRIFQNPNHIPAIMTMHGAKGGDVVIVDFSQQSLFLDGDVAKHGGLAIDCDHGGGHVGAPDALKLAGWQFFKDHPFGVSPEPYANGLPASFPKYCKIITAADAIPNPDPIDKPDAAVFETMP
jgi:hypothetical protein